MKLSEFDLKQLRAFLAVVECGGFTAAENVLGLSQSTISTSISQLEKRLGYRLCERGRGGFLLTPRGEELHAKAVRLSEAVADFEEGARMLKGALAGRIRLALIDNIITDPNCPLRRALAALRDESGGPRITIDILPPSDVEHAVAIGRADVGISIAEQRMSSLRYQHLYSERDLLFCGRDHPLFRVQDPERLRSEVKGAAKVVRSFLGHQDYLIVGDHDETIRATVTNVEAAAFLIMAGTHIGFMPAHFAQRWVDAREMKAILPSEINREHTMAIITQAGSWKSPALKHFLGKLQAQPSEGRPAPALREIRSPA
jgi:LysR family transcriptional regulator, transcriptional activator for bauABCD operon